MSKLTLVDANKVDVSLRYSLAPFLERSVSEGRLIELETRFGSVIENIRQGRVDDEQFVRRLLDGEEPLYWILHLVLHTNQFVGVLYRRCRSFCGTPCSPNRLAEMPCEWSERILWSYFESLTPLADKKPLLNDFLKYAPKEQSLVEWLVYKLHYNYHYQRLAEFGFIPPEPSRMPKAIRQLAEGGEVFRLLWIHRWYWGNQSLDAVAALLGVSPEDGDLAEQVNQVDRALLTSREFKSLRNKYTGFRRKRMDSGIPRRFEGEIREG